MGLSTPAGPAPEAESGGAGVSVATGDPSYVEVGRLSKLFLAGGVAGVLSRTATAPIDRVKMLLQVHEGSQSLSIREVVRRIYSEGSMRAFFRGNGTNVVKIGPETALKLSLNDSIRSQLVRDPENIQLHERMLSGALAGASAQLSIYPLEIIRTRLTLCSNGTYRGMGDAAIKIYRQEGAMAFYRGLIPSLVGILPYAGVDITTFEILKDILLEHYQGQPPPTVSILAVGTLSSSFAQFVSYPLALVRTRMQMQGVGGKSNKYAGMIDVMVKAVEREGLRGLYKGLLPNMLKLAPAAGISWAVFEEMKSFLVVDPVYQR
uniref:ADP,ATP carrier protein n=1 Tax=Tetraselmis chuii TaxID=63592 RepID=A0A7S1SPR2_9CHLO|mmetsp:Transcript_23091/g.40996  ORF Transcript_23091/g.40996 Transcript_23091/m.40996 type:complete len:320 (+) Transcript_23091:112-1071(+)